MREHIAELWRPGGIARTVERVLVGSLATGLNLGYGGGAFLIKSTARTPRSAETPLQKQPYLAAVAERSKRNLLEPE